MIEEADPAVTGFDHAIAEQALRYSGALGVGPATDTQKVDPEHNRCVVYCLNARRKHRHLGCPSCYGKIAVRAISGDEIEPAGTRFMWLLGAFLGGWAMAWQEATIGMVRGGVHRGDSDRHGDHGHHRPPELTT